MSRRLTAGSRRTLRAWKWPIRIKRALFESALYAWTLRGSTPKALATVPLQPWPGNANRGAEILKSDFSFGGTGSEAGARASRHGAADGGERAHLHSFAWLNDLRTVGSDAARRRARELTSDWITRHAAWDAFVWQPDILASRIVYWIAEHDFFCASANDDFRAAYFRSLAHQVRHLSRIAPGADKGAPRFIVIKALFYAAVALPGYGRRMEKARRLLEQEVRRQILADGTHVERCPLAQLTVLRTLVDIRTCLNAGGHDIPTSLGSAIGRMAPALRALRHGDGRLALFNGTNEGEAWLVDAILAQANAPGRAPDELRHAGFQRLKAGRTLIIADIGTPPPPGFDRMAHAGTLSFEMSVGKERLIVNCGIRSKARGLWSDAQRATAAHSTLVVDDTNSSEIRDDGSLGRRPQNVEWRREEADNTIFLEASHDGYREPFGAMHRRRIYLSADGYDIRGEDSMVGARPCRFSIRFHLHPTVRSSLLAGGKDALLRLPGGDGWRLQTSGATLHLEESIYFGSEDEGRRTEQLVLQGQSADGGAVVKWALKRIGPVS